MPNKTLSQETTFGYLSVINSVEHGYFGGYLIVGPVGRPLEFHCTAPIRPSRAQQILYGPTLEPFLLGEQIAGAMLNAAKLGPALILANCEATLHVRSRLNVPIVLLCGKIESAPESNDQTANLGASGDASIARAAAAPLRSGLHDRFSVGNYEL